MTVKHLKEVYRPLYKSIIQMGQFDLDLEEDNTSML